MWNQIRGPPLVHRNPQTGQVGFFAGGHGYQFIAETYIVFGIYGAIVMGVVLMNEAPKGSGESSKKKNSWANVVSVVGVLMVTFFFSLILSIFRSKYQGYPYSLFL